MQAGVLEAGEGDVAQPKYANEFLTSPWIVVEAL